MKTLDEVIKANECCDHGDLDSRCEDCPYSGIGACCLERESDALHYLKEFKRISARLEKIALGNITETLEKLDNPALTWNELKTMEGKPVWVEESADNGLWWTYWVIWQDENAVLPEKTYGTTWQAYRKER